MKFTQRLHEEFSFIRGNYLILVISWVLMDFANEMPTLYYGPFVIYDLHATAEILGFIGFASIIALAAVQFPGGYLADRYGRRWLISTLTFGVAFSFIFYVFAPSWQWILIGAIIGNLCLLYQPALMAMISDSTPPEKRGMAFSLTTLIGNVATTPAPIVAGIIVAVFTRGIGMRIAYGIVVLLYLAAAILRSRLTETIKTDERIELLGGQKLFASGHSTEALGYVLLFAISATGAVFHNICWLLPGTVFGLLAIMVTIENRQALGSQLARGRGFFAMYSRSITESVAVWKKVPRTVFFLFIANILITFGISLGQLFFAVYAVEGEKSVLNISQIDWALVSTALFIAMILAAIPIGKAIDKVGRKVPLLLSHLVFIPAVLLFVYGDLPRLFVAMPLLGLGQLLFFSSFASLQTDLVPRENRAKVIGFSQFVGYVFMALGLLAGGIIYAFSPQLPFFLLMMFIIPSFIIIAFLVHEPEQRQAG
jgi:MFS family permease